MERKPVFEIVEYKKEISEWSKEISVKENEINFNVDTLEDAHSVARLAKLKSYGIIKRTPDEKGELWSSNKGERVFVSPEVLVWEKEVNKQEADEKARREKAIKDINALPKKVTLYKDNLISITAERSKDASNEYGGFDVKYYATIKIKKSEHNFSSYLTDGYHEKKVLRQKFSAMVYEETHQEEYRKTSWFTWKNKMKDLPKDYVEKYGNIAKKAFIKLQEHNGKIEALKRF